MKQDQLLHTISKTIPKDKSLIEVIASILDISYASAHRRTTNNTKLSIEEAVKLAKHFNFSLDLIFNVGDKNVIPIRKTQVSTKPEDMDTYFSETAEMYESLVKTKDTSIIYTSKDLPVFHTYKENHLSKFKVFVWQKLLNTTFSKKKFSEYIIPISLKKNYLKAGQSYQLLNSSEIWDITTINSTLKQILYYNSINQLTNNEALTICKELKNTIFDLRKKATPQSSFKLYSNELLLMGNKLFITTPASSTLYIQFTAINYFSTSDKSTCDHTFEYLNRLLQNCKLINTCSEKEKDTFFNKMHVKIDSLSEHILGRKVLDF